MLPYRFYTAAKLDRGKEFGELGLQRLINNKRTADVIAETDCELIVIPRVSNLKLTLQLDWDPREEIIAVAPHCVISIFKQYTVLRGLIFDGFDRGTLVVDNKLFMNGFGPKL